jgi:hypothetical protein
LRKMKRCVAAPWLSRVAAASGKMKPQPLVTRGQTSLLPGVRGVHVGAAIGEAAATTDLGTMPPPPWWMGKEQRRPPLMRKGAAADHCRRWGRRMGDGRLRDGEEVIPHHRRGGRWW